MALHRYSHLSSEVVEPPRDGEFFFEETRAEQELTGVAGLGGRWQRIGDAMGDAIGRHPVRWMGMAVAVGVVTTSVIMKF